MSSPLKEIGRTAVLVASHWNKRHPRGSARRVEHFGAFALLAALLFTLGGCPVSKHWPGFGRGHHGRRPPHGHHGGGGAAGAGAQPDAGTVPGEADAGEEPDGDAGSAPQVDAGTPGCQPSCDGRECGSDGCDGSCGSCDATQACLNGSCVCIPSCTGRQCGPDGCGGSCGACAPDATCTEVGTCEVICVPSCEGRECGVEVCGTDCGTCDEGEFCTPDGRCACAPSCVDKQCGDDGCMGSCGECREGERCDEGSCVAVPSFADVFALFEAFGCGSCHGGSNPSAGLGLAEIDQAHAQLVNVPSRQCASSMPGRLRVVPGAPDQSYLINKLTGQGMCGGQRMPRSVPGATPAVPMSEQQIDTIREWITAGAQR